MKLILSSALLLLIIPTAFAKVVKDDCSSDKAFYIKIKDKFVGYTPLMPEVVKVKIKCLDSAYDDYNGTINRTLRAVTDNGIVIELGAVTVKTRDKVPAPFYAAAFLKNFKGVSNSFEADQDLLAPEVPLLTNQEQVDAERLKAVARISALRQTSLDTARISKDFNYCLKDHLMVHNDKYVDLTTHWMNDKETAPQPVLNGWNEVVGSQGIQFNEVSGKVAILELKKFHASHKTRVDAGGTREKKIDVFKKFIDSEFSPEQLLRIKGMLKSVGTSFSDELLYRIAAENGEQGKELSEVHAVKLTDAALFVTPDGRSMVHCVLRKFGKSPRLSLCERTERKDATTKEITYGVKSPVDYNQAVSVNTLLKGRDMYLAYMMKDKNSECLIYQEDALVSSKKVSNGSRSVEEKSSRSATKKSSLPNSNKQ